MLLAVVAALAVAAPAFASTPNDVTRGSYTVQRAVPASAEVVHMGIEPVQVYSVNLGAGTWASNFFIWWRWRGAIDPTTTTTILNATDATTNYDRTWLYKTADGAERPRVLPDGEHYQQAFVSVGLGDTFPLGAFPLDRQDLQIRVENGLYDANQLVYVPDVGHVSRDAQISVPGWNTRSVSEQSYIHTYGTDFGLGGSRVAHSAFSAFVLTISVARPGSPFWIKLLLPLMIVLISAVGALLIPPEYYEPRLAIAATGLLTLIFLQQVYSGDLPSPVPVVFMDDLYAIALVAVFVTFTRIIWATRLERASAGDPGATRGIMRVDHRFATIIGIVAPLAMIGVYLLTR